MRILRFSILLLVGILTTWSFFPIPIETRINYVEKVKNKRVFALPSMVEVDPVVYEDMTLTELAMKLDRSLSSTVQGQGYLFASYSLEQGVDPYLAVAIMLHETGCGWECSSLVKSCNNVGGQKGYPSCGTGGYQRFEYDNYMNGNPWPIANLWMTLYYIQTGEKRKAKETFDFVVKTAGRHYLLGEQIDNATLQPNWVIGLGWSHAMFIIVLEKLFG